MFSETDPVAMIAFSNDTREVPSSVLISSSFFDINRACPVRVLTFLVFANWKIPELRFEIIEFFHLRISSIFISGSAKYIPFFFASLASSIIFDKYRSAFEGIQPRLRQTPPNDLSLSIRTTLFPRSAARNAAA